MKHVLIAFALTASAQAQALAQTQALARTPAQMIADLRSSSNSYFFDAHNVHAASVFTVQKAARSIENVYLKNRVCKVTAYIHLFTFGQVPAAQLTPGESYSLLHVRRDDWEDENANLRIAIGSIYSNPRVLMLDCALRKTDSVKKLKAALQDVFEIRY